MTLPTNRTTANTAAEHVADHNTVHAAVNLIESGAYEVLDPNHLTVGESTFPRQYAASSRALSTGNMFLAYFTARKTETITQVRLNCITAAAATPTLIRIGVWTADDAGALLVQQAATPNDTTLLAAANTDYTKAFSSSFTKTAGVRYAVGCLVVTAAANPIISAAAGAAPGFEASKPPRLVGFVGSQADLPASVAAGGVSANNIMLYAVLLP